MYRLMLSSCKASPCEHSHPHTPLRPLSTCPAARQAVVPALPPALHASLHFSPSTPLPGPPSHLPANAGSILPSCTSLNMFKLATAVSFSTPPRHWRSMNLSLLSWSQLHVLTLQAILCHLWVVFFTNPSPRSLPFVYSILVLSLCADSLYIF